MTEHSEHWYDYTRNDPNRKNPFMTQNLPEKDDAPWLDTTYDGFMTHEEMLEVAAQRVEENIKRAVELDTEIEEAAKREAENKARAAVEKLYAENGDALQQLAEIEKEELTVSRKNRVQQIMNEYYSKLGPGPYYYDNSAVAAALREAVEGLNIEPDPDRELSMEKHYFIKGQNWVKDAILNLAVELEVEEL